MIFYVVQDLFEFYKIYNLSTYWFSAIIYHFKVMMKNIYHLTNCHWTQSCRWNWNRGRGWNKYIVVKPNRTTSSVNSTCTKNQSTLKLCHWKRNYLQLSFALLWKAENMLQPLLKQHSLSLIKGKFVSCKNITL